MHSQRFGLRVASSLFGLMSFAQLVRALKHVEIVVAGRAIPVSLSVVAFLVLAGLSLWLWQLSNRSTD